MANKTGKPLSLRLSEDENEQLDRIVEHTGQDKSKVIRKILFSEGKIVFLSKGSEIASQLYQLNSKLDTYRASEKITAFEMEEVRKELGKIAAIMCDIVQHLTDFRVEEGSGDEHCEDD